MKKFILVAALIVTLTACSSQPTIGASEQSNSIVSSLTVKSSEEFQVKDIKGSSTRYIRFGGFSNKLDSGEWIVSFAGIGNYSINYFYVVKEGDIINYENDASFKIIKLEPNKNQITIGSAK